MTTQPHDTPISINESELLALADRLTRLPFYTGKDLRAKTYNVDTPETDDPADVSIFMVESKWRDAIVAALRTAASKQASPSPAGREELREEIARDQYGQHWIMFEKNDAKWAVGLDGDGIPMIRLCVELKDNCGWTLHTELSKPRGIRNLTRLASTATSRAEVIAECAPPKWHCIQDAIDAWVAKELPESEAGSCILSWSDRIAQAIESLASSAPAGQGGWMTIESAPKDGTEVLITTAGYGMLVRVGFWDTARDGVWSVWPGRAQMQPTHWQPLPAPPLTTHDEGVV